MEDRKAEPIQHPGAIDHIDCHADDRPKRFDSQSHVAAQSVLVDDKHNSHEDILQSPWTEGIETTAPLESKGHNGHSKRNGVPVQDMAEAQEPEKVLQAAHDPSRSRSDGSLLPQEMFSCYIRWDSDERATAPGIAGLGVDLEVVDNMVLVAAVLSSGPIQRWNVQNSNFVMATGDRIMEVNGVTGDSSAILTALTIAGQDLEVLCRRPKSFYIQIAKNGNDLGLCLQATRTRHNTLKVVKMRDNGIIPKWNKENSARKVRLGDRIVCVNDVGGDPKQMLDILRRSNSLNLKVMRPV